MFLDSLRRLITLTESITSPKELKDEKFKGFVGIIAADPDIIRQAIEAKYPGFKGDPLCYMDKLFTITHSLPVPTNDDWKHYLHAQWKNENLPGMVNTGDQDIASSHYLDPLTTYFQACDRALTPRHANIFLRHLKIAIATADRNSFSKLKAGSEKWKMAIGLALFGIASPRNFTVARNLGNMLFKSFIEYFLHYGSESTLTGDTYGRFTDRTFIEDWGGFKLEGVLRILERLEKQELSKVIDEEYIASLHLLPSGVAHTKIRFDKSAQYLRFKGVMSESEKEELLGMSSDDNYQKAIETIHFNSNKASQDYLNDLCYPFEEAAELIWL